LLDGKPVAKGRWCGIYLVSFAGKSYYVPIFNEILSCNHSFASGIPGKIVMSSYAMQQLFFYDNLCSVEALESYVGMPEFEKLVYNNFFEAVGTPAFFVDDARATNNQKTAKIFDYSKVILRNENGRIQINRKMYDAVVKAGEDAKRRQGRKDGVLW
jgi:hypothetical protein